MPICVILLLYLLYFDKAVAVYSCYESCIMVGRVCGDVWLAFGWVLDVCWVMFVGFVDELTVMTGWHLNTVSMLF